MFADSAVLGERDTQLPLQGREELLGRRGLSRGLPGVVGAVGERACPTASSPAHRGQVDPEPVSESVTQLCDTLTEMVNGSNPRVQTVMWLTVGGWTQPEMAELLDIKLGDVENARFAYVLQAHY